MKRAARSKPFIRKSLSHKTHFAGRFGATYFITICCDSKGRNQLCHEHVATAIFKTALIYDDRELWYVRLLLLMPDHLHALIGIDANASLSSTVGNFKRAVTSSLALNGNETSLIIDCGMTSFTEKAAYIRHNPVRARLVTMERDWPYVLDRAAFEMAVR